MSDADDRAAALAEIIDKAQVFILPAIATEGAKQIINLAIIGAVTSIGAGIAVVTVTAFGMANSPKAVNVPLANDDTVYTIASKVRAALAAVPDITGFFSIAGAGVNVQLTALSEAANDGTMNAGFALGTVVGPTPVPTSTIIQQGAVSDLTAVETILDKYKTAQRWEAGGVVTTGMKILPLTPNSRYYAVSKGGTFSDTEPFPPSNYPFYQQQVVDGDIVLEDWGAAPENIYDLDSAIQSCWESKAAVASRFMKTGGVDMSKLFDNCMKMAEMYETAWVGNA
jgi:hypothetical protein